MNHKRQLQLYRSYALAAEVKQTNPELSSLMDSLLTTWEGQNWSTFVSALNTLRTGQKVSLFNSSENHTYVLKPTIFEDELFFQVGDSKQFFVIGDPTAFLRAVTLKVV